MNKIFKKHSFHWMTDGHVIETQYDTVETSNEVQGQE